jgi:Bacterial TSP3 repeat
MKKRLSRLLMLLGLAVPLLLSGCGGGDGGATASNRVSGLTDAQITLFGTSPVLDDTDGDGISDDREVNELGFDPDINPYRFNPLVADLPRLGLVLRSPPTIRLFLTDAVAETKTIEVDRTYETTIDIIQNVTDTVTESISLAQDVAQDTTFSGGVAGDVTLTDSILKTMSEAVEIDFTKEQSEEHRKALTEIEAFEKDHSITASGGLIKFTVEIQNNGDVAFQVVTLVLSVAMADSSHPGRFIPIANLVPQVDPPRYDPYPPYVIPPGGRFPAVVYINETLDLETAKELLKDAKSLIVSVAGLELLDADGVPFAFRVKDINSRSALVVIDYAGLRSPERYMVATNADPNSPGITAGHALKDILRIPVEAGPIDYGGQQKVGLLDLRNDPNVRADRQKNSFWLAVRTRGNGINRKVTRFNMLEKDYDFENIQLKAGDTLYLVYMEDKDGDGVFSRQERLLGTSDLLADSDGDGWSDFYEINVSHTDPNNPDTDGDGVIDSKDSAPLNPSIL